MRLTLCSSCVNGFASARTDRRVRISPQATKCEMIIVMMLRAVDVRGEDQLFKCVSITSFHLLPEVSSSTLTRCHFGSWFYRRYDITPVTSRPPHPTPSVVYLCQIVRCACVCVRHRLPRIASVTGGQPDWVFSLVQLSFAVNT